MKKKTKGVIERNLNARNYIVNDFWVKSDELQHDLALVVEILMKMKS